MPCPAEVVEALRTATRTEVRGLLEGWLDALEPKGRWALLKLMTGALRVGLSARLAKTAAAMMRISPCDGRTLKWWTRLAKPST